MTPKTIVDIRYGGREARHTLKVASLILTGLICALYANMFPIDLELLTLLYRFKVFTVMVYLRLIYYKKEQRKVESCCNNTSYHPLFHGDKLCSDPACTQNRGL